MRTMRNFLLLSAIVLLAGPAGPSAAQAPKQTSPASDIVVEESWAPTTIGQSKTGVAYMTIVNHGEAPDRLVGASSPAAGKVELHMSDFDGGIARMRAMPDMDLKPHQPVSLKPGGLHLMLFDLRAPLAAGGQIPITLIFEKAGAIEVSVNVGAPAGGGAGPDHEHN